MSAGHYGLLLQNVDMTRLYSLIKVPLNTEVCPLNQWVKIKSRVMSKISGELAILGEKLHRMLSQELEKINK